MARTILITGGAGFLGCNLAADLMAAGDRVSVLDNLHPQVHPKRRRPLMLPDGADLLVGDVVDRSNWDAVLMMVEPDVIVHLAAETGTGQSLTQASRHARVNVLGTAELLDALTRCRRSLAQLLVVSSRAVYGEGEWEEDGIVFSPGPRTHAALSAGHWDPLGPAGGAARPVASRAGLTPASPTSVYAATKLAQEHLFQAWCAATGTPLTVFRFQNLYGPGQSLTNSYTGLLVHFARMATAGNAIEVYEDGRIVRDFLYIDDASAALCAAIERPPTAARLVDVGSGQPVTLLEVAREVAVLADAPEPVVTGQFRDGDVRAASCDIDAARHDLGWSPTVDRRQGLPRLLAWVAAATAPLDGDTAMA